MTGSRIKKKAPKKRRYIVETKNLVKVFGKLRAVDGLTLRIKPGQLYGLLGPNGSGKTTTIRMLIGLLKITNGKAWIFGKKVPEKALASRIGYMPQETSLYNDISVMDNLVLFGEMHNVTQNTIKKRAMKLLRFVDLEGWENELVVSLSGGMRHRASLACSMMHDPELYFLDEPTVGVDPILRDNFWTYFKKLSRQGKTLIITTHYIEEARNCDMVGLMRLGKLVDEDTPDNLLKKTGTKALEDAFLELVKQTEDEEGLGEIRRPDGTRAKRFEIEEGGGGE